MPLFAEYGPAAPAAYVDALTDVVRCIEAASAFPKRPGCRHSTPGVVALLHGSAGYVLLEKEDSTSVTSQISCFRGLHLSSFRVLCRLKRYRGHLFTPNETKEET